MFEKVFGVDKKKVERNMKERPIDSGTVQYMGGHKAYPSPQWTEIYFYENRFELLSNSICVYYSKINDVGNSNEMRREADRLVLGIIALPLALAYLWKKNHIYTIIQYDDGIDTQTIVIDFLNNINFAQALIYKKMLEYRKKQESEKLNKRSPM